MTEIHSALTIGVLGGMGPRATVILYERLVHRLESRGPGTEWPRILIDSLPVSNMFDGRPDELRALLRTEVRCLEVAGAQIIGVACNSAHRYFADMQDSLCDEQTVLLNLVEETVDCIIKAGHARPAMLATHASMPLYLDALHRRGVKPLLPDGPGQTQVEEAIREVLTGRITSKTRRRFVQLADRLLGQAADCLVLGCTDLPLLFEENSLHCPVVSSLDVMVEALLPDLRSAASNSPGRDASKLLT